jgi:hypothetical protein
MKLNFFKHQLYIWNQALGLTLELSSNKLTLNLTHYLC